MSGEDALIQRWFAPLAGPAGLGLRDDAACLKPPAGRDLVLTADALVAGVHFFCDDPPGLVARKALRVNLSDLAAKGADPLGFMLSIAVPPELPRNFFRDFSRGLGEDIGAYRCPLLGGDTVATAGPLVISIKAIGSVPRGQMRRRDTARPGDLVFVTGTIGDSGLGLKLRKSRRFGTNLTPSEKRFLLDRYQLPQPRIRAARAIRRFARAAMDISDGLTGDLVKLCACSRVGARIRAATIPFSQAARKLSVEKRSIFQFVINCGDDYEILGAVAKKNFPPLRAALRKILIPVTTIGEFVSVDEGVEFVDETGKALPITLGGYSHFLVKN